MDRLSVAVNKVNIRRLSQTKKLFSNYFQKFLLATNELGTALSLGAVRPIGIQVFMYYVFCLFGPCCFGADGCGVMLF